MSDNRPIKTMYRLRVDVKDKGKWCGCLGAPFPMPLGGLENYILGKKEEGYSMFRIRIDTIYYKDFPDSLNPKEMIEVIRGS